MREIVNECDHIDLFVKYLPYLIGVGINGIEDLKNYSKSTQVFELKMRKAAELYVRDLHGVESDDEDFKDKKEVMFWIDIKHILRCEE